MQSQWSRERNWPRSGRCGYCDEVDSDNLGIAVDDELSLPGNPTDVSEILKSYRWIRE